MNLIQVLKTQPNPFNNFGLNKNVFAAEPKLLHA